MSDLFSYAAEGARLRDKGIARASAAQEHHNPKWHDRAYAALIDLARRQPTLHIDDFLAFFPERPERPNSAGSIWLRARRMGILIPTEQMRPCATDKGKHAHVYPVYRSTEYRRGSQ